MKKNSIMRLFLGLALIGLFCISCSGEQEQAHLTTVRLVTDNRSFYDHGYNEAAWSGILHFYGEQGASKSGLGTAYDVLTSKDPGLYEVDMVQFSQERPDLIITTFAFANAAAAAAKTYEDQKFLMLDFTYAEPLPNVMQAVFAEYQGSYLVGVAAAAKALEDSIENPTFGFIGGMASSAITRFEVGYMQGVLSVLPDAQFVEYYTNDWESRELAKAAARKWYNNGVYTIFAAAGGAGLGMIEEAAEQRKRGQNVWAIGVDSDQYDLGKYTETDSAVLTSMMKKIDTVVEYTLRSVEENSFKGEVVTFDLENGGVEYSASNAALSSAIKERLEHVKQQIIDDSIVVYSSYEEAKLLPNFPQNLQAVDWMAIGFIPRGLPRSKI